ncbi:winged helix DNA-binding domain-containing protein [Rothia sp. LK2588]|uniref:winged helix DNA-binding domain-containing protein n=1 Tax=Rothia sp. LK2588 TaxID=3114369 RepID=UPI0034CEB1D3
MSVQSTGRLSPRQELQARRLIAQGLAASQARPQLNTPEHVIEHLLALQGQNYRAGVQAIATRIRDGQDYAADPEKAVAAVHRAIAAHRIVRAWPMRGTLHFLSGREARWIMRLCGPRVESAAARRRPGLGFSDGDFETARDALHHSLLDVNQGETISRTAAYEVFAQAGIDPSQGRGPHLLRALGGMGDVVQSGLENNAETFHHVDRLSIAQREVPADAALAELGTRYVNGHGPVTAADIAWWSYLTQRDAKRALETAEKTARITIGDAEYVIPAWQRDVTENELEAALERTLHLPAFDEYLLGYSDKSFTMADEIRHEVLTKNGISWDFTVTGGEVMGRTRS